MSDKTTERYPLLYFPISDPQTVIVSRRARVHVEGDTYWAWDADDARDRAAGGSVLDLNTGQERCIADILRACLPADDPRWSAEIPEPFFSPAPIGS